jgi:hypothetical protein
MTVVELLNLHNDEFSEADAAALARWPRFSWSSVKLLYRNFPKLTTGLIEVLLITAFGLLEDESSEEEESDEEWESESEED